MARAEFLASTEFLSFIRFKYHKGFRQLLGAIGKAVVETEKEESYFLLALRCIKLIIITLN